MQEYKQAQFNKVILSIKEKLIEIQKPIPINNLSYHSVTHLIDPFHTFIAWVSQAFL